MLDQIPIQEISTLAIWIPIILAALRLKTGDRKLRLFFAFLLMGAMTDGFGWLTYRKLELEWLYFYHAFSLFLYQWLEALFFSWLVFEFLQTKNNRFWKKVLWTGISLLFLIEGILRFGFSNPEDIYTSFLFSGILVLNAFLLAFALLGLAETNGDIMNDPWFWILSGIFFYSFSCFFIDMLAYTDLGQQLWPFRTLLNIIQYVFFVVGLMKMRNEE